MEEVMNRARAVQISAPISKETRLLLERYVRATGVKRGHLIETALLHHLAALAELPSDVVVPPRLLLTRDSFDKLADRLFSPGQPTRELSDLMRGNGD